MIIVEQGVGDYGREQSLLTLWQALGRPESLGYAACVSGGAATARASLGGVTYTAAGSAFAVCAVAAVGLRMEGERLLGDIAGYSANGLAAQPVTDTITETINGFTTKTSRLRVDFSVVGDTDVNGRYYGAGGSGGAVVGTPTYSGGGTSLAFREYYNPFPAVARLRITGTADDTLKLVVFTGPVRDASGEMLAAQPGFLGGRGGGGFGTFIAGTLTQTGTFQTVKFECDVPQGGWFRFNVENPSGGYMGYGLDISLSAQIPTTEVVTTPVIIRTAAQVAVALAIERLVIAPADRVGVGWWDIEPASRSGRWVRQLGATDVTSRYRHEAGRGTVPAVVVHTSSTQPTARAATNAQFGEAQFLARDWVLVDATAEPRDLTAAMLSLAVTAAGRDAAWMLFASSVAQPPTDPGGGSGASGVEELNAAIELPNVETYPLIRAASYPSVLTRITIGLAAGTATVVVQIEDLSVATLSLTTTETVLDIAAPLQPGQSLTLLVTEVGTAAMLSATFTFQR